MTTQTPVDVDVLRAEIAKTYTDVSAQQDAEFIFPTGRAWAQTLDYPEPPRRHVRALGVRGHAPQGGAVRRHGRDDPGDQAGLSWRVDAVDLAPRVRPLHDPRQS
jgi:hypothetical protein